MESIKLKDGKVFLFDLKQLTDTVISFHLLPGGIVVKDHASESSFAINLKQVLGVCEDNTLYNLLIERGLIPEKKYPLLFLGDGYYLDPNLLK